MKLQRHVKNEKILLEIVGLSSSHSQIGHYALVLGERHGNRRLPIIIGGAEAQAIALELENIKTNRPMTHDLIYNLARHFHINLQEVVITELKEGIFFARLIMESQGEFHEIDSRPSDAVAIGVRFKVPIYTYETVLSEAGVVLDSEETEQENQEEDSTFTLPSAEPAEESKPSKAGKINKDKINQLKKKLEEAISGEDYEAAARLRDEIKKIEGE